MMKNLHLGWETCTLHLISDLDQQGRKQMCHWIREAKNLLSLINILCLVLSEDAEAAEAAPTRPVELEDTALAAAGRPEPEAPLVSSPATATARI